MRSLAHRAWTTADGLPQSSVHAIAQTPDGFLWIATEAGLARYDGAQFALYDRGTLRQLPSNDLCCLAVAREGTLWVGSSDGLLALRNGHALPLPRQLPFRGAAITSVTPRPDGGVEAIAGGTRFVVDAASAAFATASSATSSFAASEPVSVRGAAQGWSATPAGITVRAGERTLSWNTGRELPRGRVQAVWIARDGIAWVGMSNGLLAIDPVSRRAKLVAVFAGRSILSLFEDREADLWVGTETAGLYELYRNAFRAVEGTSDLAVTALADDGASSVLMGTRGDGLRRWSGGGTVPAATLSIRSSGIVLAMDRATDGAQWIGTPDGLVVLDAAQHPRTLSSLDGLPDDSVRSVAALSASQAWIGTAHGLALVEGDRVRTFTTQDGLRSNLVGALLLARGAGSLAGSVWAATEGGLSLVSANGVERTYAAPDGLTSPVAAMANDEQARLWLATQDGGLWRVEQGRLQPVLRLPRVRGHALQVAAMTVAWGDLWIQASDRVLRAPLATLLGCAAEACNDTAQVFVSYGVADGMPSAETVAVASGAPLLRPDGDLWFPTRGGIAATTRAAVADAVAVPVAIEHVFADDRELPPDAPLTLPFGRTRLTLEFAGLSLRDPRTLRFRYQLAGFDAGWIDGGGRRQATYTALPPGTYTFRVQAAHEGQPWSADEASIQVRIEPPFYRRWWFLVLLIAGAAAVLGAVYLYRLALERRRFALILGERNRLAREVHDTLAQDLVSTTIQLDLVMMQLRQGRIERALDQLRGLRRFVGDGLAEARQSIAELRDGSLSMELPARVRRLVERNAALAGCTQVAIEGDARPLQGGVEREIARIVGEALTNIARHAEAASVRVTLRYAPEQLQVVIVDDGRGFLLDSIAQEEGHFGLKGMRERAETLGAQLAIASTPGHGTRIELTVREGESQ